MDLLTSHYAGGLGFEPVELIEAGDRIAVQLRVTDPNRRGNAESYKVFTFAGDQVVLLEDCVDRDDALAKLAAA